VWFGCFILRFFFFFLLFVREREGGSYPLLVLMCVLCWVRILYCRGSNKWEMSGGDERKWMRFRDNDFEERKPCKGNYCGAKF